MLDSKATGIHFIQVNTKKEMDGYVSQAIYEYPPGAFMHKLIKTI